MRLSLQEKKIYEGIISQDSSTTYAKDFGAAIKKVCFQISCQIPDEDMYITLLEWHFRYFNGFTISEIKNAFELYILKEITIEKRNDRGDVYEKVPEHYNKFSCQFYSEVMNGYLEHRNKVILKAQAEIKKEPVKTNEQIEYEEREAVKNILKKVIEDFTGDDPGIFAVKYEVLNELKIIELTKEQKADYMKQAEIKIRNNALQRGEVKEIREIAKAGVNQFETVAEAKRMAYADFIKEPGNISKVKI